MIQTDAAVGSHGPALIRHPSLEFFFHDRRHNNLESLEPAVRGGQGQHHLAPLRITAELHWRLVEDPRQRGSRQPHRLAALWLNPRRQPCISAGFELGGANLIPNAIRRAVTCGNEGGQAKNNNKK